MNPAFSVVFLTTLIGAGQGLFLALFAAEMVGFAAPQRLGSSFFVLGGAVALACTAAGLVASFFHLGRPERAWRSAAQWRTSWLSREVIVLPAFMGLLLLWTVAHALGLPLTAALGGLAALAAAALFLCTAMVYASIRFLQEWASVYTLINLPLLGLASGCTLAAALAAGGAPPLARPLAAWALLFTLAGLLTRSLALRRNARLRPRSTLQSALGIRHPQIRQRSMGFMGGSFNTREFFHQRSAGTLRHVKWGFIAAAFVLPALLLALALGNGSAPVLALAFVVQYLGLLAERWFFLAQARHPQNLYYQAVS
jgi:DMSO reductase anchor subunit